MDLPILRNGGPGIFVLPRRAFFSQLVERQTRWPAAAGFNQRGSITGGGGLSVVRFEFPDDIELPVIQTLRKHKELASDRASCQPG